MNFDEIINRVGTHSSKWDMTKPLYGVDPNEGISMWVADMDFRPPQVVNDALQARIDHGVFGYFADDSAYTGALANWLEKRHGFIANPSHMIQAHGLVQGLSMCLEAFTEKGDGVIIFTPVYHAFARTINAMGREVVSSALANKNGLYEMDLDALQASLKGREKMIILCSPHNPGGRVWSVEELRALYAFAKKNDLLIVSDEIHMDLVFSGHKHHVFGSAVPEANDRVVYLMSSTKTFNIAGAMTGTLLAPDQKLRAKLTAVQMAWGIGVNLFGMIACTAAFESGEKWLEEAVPYIEENARLLNEGLAKIPGVKPMQLQSTYLSWVDFRDLGLETKDLHNRIHQDAKIAANHGDTFGDAGKGFLRFNVATPRANVLRAIENIQEAFKDIQ